MEAGRGLKVVDLQMSDLMRTMENAIQFGNPVLLQDVLEEIDPSLEPILAKSFVKKGNQVGLVRADCTVCPSGTLRCLRRVESSLILFLAGWFCKDCTLSCLPLVHDIGIIETLRCIT